MKKLILLGFIAGLLGTVSAILITEAISFSNNWQYFIVGSVISVSISILLVRTLYGKYIEFTKDSQDAISQAKQALKQR
jgi:membrane protein implicated in regulation of membrane protease activity